MTPLKHNPLLRSAFWVFACLLLLTLMIMGGSLWISFSTQNEAKRINISGSLRMQSYLISQYMIRLESPLAQNPQNGVSFNRFQHALIVFDRRLNSHVMRELLNLSPQDPQRVAYLNVQERWRQLNNELRLMKTKADKKTELSRLHEIDQFVSKINEMVYLIQSSTEKKVTRLIWLHGLGIIAILLISLMALQRFYQRIVIPLKALSDATMKAKQGALDVRLKQLNDDELGRLGQAFNQMAESLEKSHNELAGREKEKSFKLHERTSTLELLYKASCLMNLESMVEGGMDGILDRLQTIVGGGSFTLSLTAFASTKLAAQVNPSRFILPDGQLSKTILFPIADKQREYGKLILSFDDLRAKTELNNEHKQLIETICDQIAAGLGQAWQNEQTWHFLLVEERATIARELHDSLAQALSFMKIQLSRWQKMSKQGVDKVRLDDYALEIRKTLDSAYVQLRELLTTFRLKVSQPGLKPALNATAAEYRERGELSIELDFPLDSERICCRPDAEIHIIQIVREALSNVVRHANARAVRVSIRVIHETGMPRLRIVIEDDGIGMTGEVGGVDHHGLLIMHERAKHLDAEIKIENSLNGANHEGYQGIRVVVICPLSSVEGRDAPNHDI